MSARAQYAIDPPLEEQAGDQLRASVSQVLVRGDETQACLEIFNGVPDPIYLDQLSLDRAANRSRAIEVIGGLLGDPALAAPLDLALVRLARRLKTWVKDRRAADTADEADNPEREDEGGQERVSQATALCQLAETLALFHTADGTAYARVPVASHLETRPLRSKAFRTWLAHRYYQVEGNSPRAQAVQDALTTLEGRALFDGSEQEVYTRVAQAGDTIYIDLCDDGWRVIRVQAGGWTVLPGDQVPVFFRRSGSMLTLPEPARGGTVDLLRKFINVHDDDWPLVVAWLLAALRLSGPFPLLVLLGQQGTAKSTLGRLLRSLLDPSTAPLRCEPKEPRDLAIAAKNSWVTAYDNISRLPSWLSDALCRLSTGGGFGTRLLYSDDEEMIIDVSRPGLLTSITDVVTQPDLLDRALLIRLPVIGKKERKPEKKLWAAFHAVHAQILGALLDAVAAGLGNLPTTTLPELPRLADFALWAVACEPALGGEAGAFLEAYTSNITAANTIVLEESPLVPAIRLLLAQTCPWEGTATELLAALEAHAAQQVEGGKVEQVRKLAGWPKAPNGLSNCLTSIAPNLRADGIEVIFSPRTKHGRTITLQRVPDAPDPANNNDGAVRKESTGQTPSSPPPSSPARVIQGDDGGDDPFFDEVTASSPGGASSDVVTMCAPTVTMCTEGIVTTNAGTHQRESGAGDDGDDGDDLSRLHSSSHVATPLPAIPYTLVTDAAGVVRAVEVLAQHPILAFDTETTGLDPHRDRLRLLTLAADGATVLIDTWAVPGWQDMVRPLFADTGRTVIAHYAAFDLRFLLAAGIEVDAVVHDTLIMAQLIDGGAHFEDVGQDDGTTTTRRLSYALAALVERTLGQTLSKEEQRSDWGGDRLTGEQLSYAALDAAILVPLYAKQAEALAAEGLERVAAIEAGCTPCLAAMMLHGMPFDSEAWRALAEAAVLEQHRLKRQIGATLAPAGANQFGGFKFSPDSPAQIGLLLERLGIQVAKNDKGHTIVDEAALLAVRDAHPVIPLLLSYRDAAKRSSVYGIQFAARHVHPATGRIHADYKQLGSAAGRMSCKDPNLQQVPRAKDYRACFRPREGRAIVKADYNQVEVRIIAAIAGDRALLDAYDTGADVYRRTAAVVLGVPEDAVTQDQRQLGKVLVLGLQYGMGSETLAQHAAGYGIGLDLDEANRYRDRFFHTYAGLRRWHREQLREAITTRTLAGRRRVGVESFMQKVNTPVQGSGADGLKLGLARLWQHRHEAPTARLVNVVHDEIVAECPIDDAPAVADWLKRHMVAAMAEIVDGKVPIEVEATIAADWAGTPLTTE